MCKVSPLRTSHSIHMLLAKGVHRCPRNKLPKQVECPTGLLFGWKKQDIQLYHELTLTLNDFFDVLKMVKQMPLQVASG